MIILIDEPERHLHRSIATPLLLSLFDERPDCAFIISTHDVSLPIDVPNATTLVLRSCTWSGKRANFWDADIVSMEIGVGDGTRREILGSRRKILFVEGSYTSLDLHTYTILYPEISVIPKGSCADVIQTVKGIRNSENLHWLKAYGLIDRDNRNVSEVDDLANRGIFALDCYSIESLYYSGKIIDKIAKWQLDNDSAGNCAESAKDAVIEEMTRHKDRLCSFMTVKRARNAIELQLPTHDSMLDDPVYCIQIDTGSFLAEECKRFDDMVSNKDTDGLIGRYNVATTGALDAAARRLGLLGHRNYEGLVRKLLDEDESAREYLRQRLSRLSLAIDEEV